MVLETHRCESIGRAQHLGNEFDSNINELSREVIFVGILYTFIRFLVIDNVHPPSDGIYKFVFISEF